MSQEIIAKDLFPFVHYEYGEAFYGSRNGMRYRIAREPLENVHYVPVDKRGEASLRVTIWPGPYNYIRTPEEQKESRDYPFEAPSMEAIAAWLNEMYEGRDWKALESANS